MAHLLGTGKQVAAPFVTRSGISSPTNPLLPGIHAKFHITFESYDAIIFLNSMLGGSDNERIRCILGDKESMRLRK